MWYITIEGKVAGNLLFLTLSFHFYMEIDIALQNKVLISYLDMLLKNIYIIDLYNFKDCSEVRSILFYHYILKIGSPEKLV